MRLDMRLEEALTKNKLLEIMEKNKQNILFRALDEEEISSIEGGSVTIVIAAIGAAATIFGATCAGAYYLGYYHGRRAN